MGLLQPESGLLFWMVISFGVVFVLLAKFGFPVITRMVEERRVYVEKSLEAAKQANEQLAGIKSESEALLQKAREEQMRILNEAAAAKQRIIEEAKAQAQNEGQKQLEPDTARKGGGHPRGARTDRHAVGRHRRESDPGQARQLARSDDDDRADAGRNALHETIAL